MTDLLTYLHLLFVEGPLPLKITAPSEITKNIKGVYDDVTFMKMEDTIDRFYNV